MQTPLEQTQYRLALDHECRWISCTDMDCPLCVQSSDRCFHNFSTSQVVRSLKRNDKISAGACVFKADCGAPISLTIIKIDGSQVEPLPRLKMQFTLVEYTEHLERHLNGMDFPAAQDVVGSILPMQLGLRQLLKAEGGQETYDNEDQLVLPFEHLDRPHPSQPHNQVFSKPVNVYVDTPLRNIVNCHSERVKRVGLLVRAVGHEDKILPALSTPFMLYTRRRDAKDTIPRPSDRVRDLSDMSDATCARLINLRQSAKDQGNVGVPLEQLPDEPISTAGQMYDFLEGKSEDFLAVVSMKVLKRPKDCLLNLRKELDSKMIKMENDTRPRVWRDDKDPDGTCLLYAASKGICNLIFTATNPKVYDSDWKLVSTTDTDWERRQNHDLAVAAWHQPGHPDWGFDPRHSPPRKVGSAAAAAAPPASTWSKALQPQAASTGQAQQPQVGSSPLALLGGLPGGFSYPEGGWPRSLSQATGLQDQASMSEALATAVSSQSHLRQMMQNPYSQGGSGRPPGLQSQPGSGAATSAPSSGQSLVPPYLQGISFTRLSAHSPSRQIGNRFVEAPEPLPDYLEESSVAAPQSAAASPIPTSVLEPNACMGPPLTPWSNGDHAIYRPGPAAQQKATRAPHAMQLPSTAGNATWPGFSNGSGAAGQGYLRAQNQPRLPPPETSDGVSQNPKFPPQQAAPPLSWQEPLTGPQPMQLSPQETIAREAGLGPEASQAPLTLPGRPLGTGRTTAASLQPPAPLQVPSALGESMLHLCDPATAAYGEAAGSVKAMLEDIAKLPSNLLVGGSRPNSAILTPFLARLERQLTSDLAAPVAELLKTLERLASAPEYRCVFVGLAESGKSTVLDAIKDLSLASTSQNGASSTPVENLAERVHEHEAMVAGVTLGLVDTPGHLGGPSSDTRQELGDQLRRADAVFLVLDYNSLDASLEWAQERLAWLKLGDRLHVVVNKVEDASLIHNCENEQEAAKRIRQFLFSRDLAVPNNQVWLLSASEARLCMSIRLRQAGLLRREGNVQDKLFRLMVWGRQAPAAISDAEFTREVEAAFAKSGLGRLGRESVAMLHKRVGSRRLMDAVQSAEALLARARNSCLVFDAALERNSMIAAQVHQQVDEGQAAGSQQQQPCFLPQLVRRSLSAITAWISSPVPMGMELPVVKLQPLIYFMQELASSPALKELVEAAKEIAEVDGSREPQLHQQGILNFFKRKVATLGVELQNYDPASMWAKSDSKQRALHCQQWVRGQLRVGALAGAGTGSDVQSQDQSGLIRTAAEAMVGEGLLGGLVQQQPGWQDVLEEARRDLQESLLRLLTRQPEGMQEFVSELADLCRSLPASDWGAWLGVESLEELEERLSAVREAMTWFQACPLPELGSFAQRCHTWQQQVGADANPRVKRQRTKAFLSLFSGAAKDPEKACVECGTKTTHEWCSGPAGPATLCQSCGKSYRRGKDSHKKEQLKDAKTSSRIQEKEGGSASRASLRQSSEQNPPRKSTARQSKMELNKAKAGEKRKPSESDAAAALMGLRAGDSQASGPSHAAEDPDVVFYGRKKRSRAPAAAIRLDIRDQHSESDSLVSFDSADDSGSEEEACGNAMQEGSEAPSPKWCTECETTATPVWRSGPQGRKTLCNPCGVKYKASIRKEMDTSR